MRLSPIPKSVEPLPGTFGSISSLSVDLDFTPSQRFGTALRIVPTLNLQATNPNAGGIKLILAPEICGLEAYRLAIYPESITIEASTETGLYRGLTTLQHISNKAPKTLPCLKIEDSPDLEMRGYMLDISRCKVPTLETLYDLIDQLTSLKYNQLQLYTEHTFAYQNHACVWKDVSPLTAEDIRSLDSYCHNRYIELVPNQNSFGHMERWLRHDDYKHLAECPDGYIHPILGKRDAGGTLKPNQASLNFMSELYDELLPNFRSNQVNIGGDEPWELGQGWSAEETKSKGKHRVYLDHLLSIHRLVAERDKTTQFWGDIILESPELSAELPNDSIGIIWGYEADHPFESQCAAFAESGIPFYVAPGTSAWNTIGGRYANAVANIKAATRQAIEHGAKGMLLTDWGDFGHHHFPPISYPALVWASTLSWNHDSEENFDDIHAINTIFFDGESEILAQAIVSLSESINTFSHKPVNRTVLNDVLFCNQEKLQEHLEKTTSKELDSCCIALTKLHRHLADKRFRTKNASQSNQELLLTIKLLLFAINKGLANIGTQSPEYDQLESELNAFTEEYHKLWLVRNRIGGLEESLTYLTKSLQ
ncbi:MAG: family 20 glycosylhydrolase [Opitutales bacterium]|mgnify:CR=1 FL=1|nr:family 20 glycosylhydrolase [Opitutales bacterium]